MTWIEVASDAVKIGLGALIAGLFTMLAAKQAQAIRKSEEYTKRKRVQIERISEDFDEVSRSSLMHVASLHALSEAAKTKKAKKELLEATGLDTLETAEEQNDRLDALHSLEARLALLALSHIAGEMENYRMLLTDLTVDGSEDKRTPDVKQMFAQALHIQRTHIVTLLAEAYQKA